MQIADGSFILLITYYQVYSVRIDVIYDIKNAANVLMLMIINILKKKLERCKYIAFAIYQIKYRVTRGVNLFACTSV